MAEKKRKSTRARAPEKKKEQFNMILEEGKELFIRYGGHGFSLRALAKRMKMSQSNLYNYVQSKRELWIAIRIKYFKEFQTFTELQLYSSEKVIREVGTSLFTMGQYLSIPFIILGISLIIWSFKKRLPAVQSAPSDNKKGRK